MARLVTCGRHWWLCQLAVSGHVAADSTALFAWIATWPLVVE